MRVGGLGALSTFGLLTFKRYVARQAYSLLLRLGTPLLVACGRAAKPSRCTGQLVGRSWVCMARRIFPGCERLRSGTSLWCGCMPCRWVKPVLARFDSRPFARSAPTCLLLTHSTATGREAGRALLQGNDLQTWLPYDTPGAVKRFAFAQTR